MQTLIIWLLIIRRFVLKRNIHLYKSSESLLVSMQNLIIWLLIIRRFVLKRNIHLYNSNARSRSLLISMQTLIIWLLIIRRFVLKRNICLYKSSESLLVCRALAAVTFDRLVLAVVRPAGLGDVDYRSVEVLPTACVRPTGDRQRWGSSSSPSSSFT